MSLVIDSICVETMIESILILSSFIALGCLGTSLEAFTYLWGICLIISGCAGCLAVIGLGGRFRVNSIFNLFRWNDGCIWVYNCYVS